MACHNMGTTLHQLDDSALKSYGDFLQRNPPSVFKRISNI